MVKYVWRDDSTSYTSEEYDSFTQAKSAAESTNQGKNKQIHIWSIDENGNDDILETLNFN